MKKNICKQLYERLYSHYGPQGWWPLRTRAGTPGFDARGYHKDDFTFPRSKDDIFEIIIGAILTQNTTWKNVEKTIQSMREQQVLNLSVINSTDEKDIAHIIRSSGYYNQKAKKLKKMVCFLLEGGYVESGHYPERKDLLSVWGIGPETADSILLYGFNKPYFIVDAYTKRFFTRLDWISGNESYDEIQKLITDKTKFSTTRLMIQYFNEYHALIVEHAKKQCKIKPVCIGCPVREFCTYL